MRSVRNAELRTRCQVLTWQELSENCHRNYGVFLLPSMEFIHLTLARCSEGRELRGEIVKWRTQPLHDTEFSSYTLTAIVLRTLKRCYPKESRAHSRANDRF